MRTLFIILFTIIFFSTILPQSNSQKNDTFSTCNQSYFTCGTNTNVSFPFWGKNRPNICGKNEFKLTCMHNQNTCIQIGSQKFNVLNINQTASTMKIVRTNLVNDICSSNFTNTSLNGSPFTYLPNVQNLTVFYNCPIENSSIIGKNINSFTCENNGSNKHVFYVVKNETQLQNQFSNLQNCGASVQVQVSMDGVSESGVEALQQGFDVKYDEGAGWSSECEVCRESGGTCGTNQNDSSHFSCYCPGGTHHAVQCSAHKSMHSFFSSLIFHIFFRVLPIVLHKLVLLVVHSC